MSQNNNSRTRAFEAVDNSANESRRKVVIAIFVVVALILAAFATLIIGKIVSNLPEKSPIVSSQNITNIPKEGGDINVGNLLVINDDFKYSIPTDFSNMIKLYDYRTNPDNASQVEVNGKLTYSLTLDSSALEENTCHAFNQMMLDYCNTIDISKADKDCASNLLVAWGGYTASTISEYESTDLPSYGKDYYDHILGTTIALKQFSPYVNVTESMLKQDYAWIYENAHKYGFIIRYPDACKNHTGFDSSNRVHIRYVGVEHATYIFQNNICFEEYLELIRNQHNSFDNALTTEIDGTTYLIYYIKYTGNPTSIPVPKNSEYTISGDNMNGFIVTVKQ